MPNLNWSGFVQLPGAPETNFEALCRALVRIHFGKFGSFVARAAQPGVEFHLELRAGCSLGAAGDWFGWQCRWYQISNGKALGTSRRSKIEKALATTRQEVPGVTDWVLWTRHPLTAGDQKWFYGLERNAQPSIRLHAWTAAEVDDYLSGEAAILRATYFGELVLTPEDLSRAHEQSVASVKRRWRPEVHQPIDAERAIRGMLGQTDTWEPLREVAQTLVSDAAATLGEVGAQAAPAGQPAFSGAAAMREIAARLTAAQQALAQGDFDLVQKELRVPRATCTRDVAALLHQLRGTNQPAALVVTNALAHVARGVRLLDALESHLEAGLVAVVAEAGNGKTHLAAQVTAPNEHRPAGLLLHGRSLAAAGTLDDLARTIVVHGRPVPSMEALIAAMDAAGERARRRLPVVIDGLNEAEDPRIWKQALATIMPVLRLHPHVLMVVTVRGAFETEALPDESRRVEIDGFARDQSAAVRRYFEYYKIDRTDGGLPWGLLAHPLTLSLYCEIANADRKQLVGVEALPGSLSAIFDRYLGQASARISEIAPLSNRYLAQDVDEAIFTIGLKLWESRSRGLSQRELRTALHDDVRTWDRSLLRALEHEGVILREPGATSGDWLVTLAYDALAGHVVASAIIANIGRSGLANYVGSPSTIALLTEATEHQHPLGGDILRGLVGLMPRRHHQQLWKLLAEPLATSALRYAANLESSFLDADTVTRLGALVLLPSPPGLDILTRLQHTRGSAKHPLNAVFLDGVLRRSGIASRDRTWTEWIRRHSENIVADLERLTAKWRSTPERTEADRLRAIWVQWTLTSTVRELRDHATLALYWFGRRAPADLFALAVESLSIDDPYVSQRMLAAAFGVTMAHQTGPSEFGSKLRTFLGDLQTSLVGKNAQSPTNDYLSRLYVEGIAQMASRYYPEALPRKLLVKGRVRFAPGRPVEPIGPGHPSHAEVERVLGMDFENYTVGRLFSDRRNYDNEHGAHQEAVAHILGVVWTLGWRESDLGGIDHQLTSRFGRMESSPVDRYGKKYSWIGFFSRAGMLSDARAFPIEPEQFSDFDIDPSFPESPQRDDLRVPRWTRDHPRGDRRWVTGGAPPIPKDLLLRDRISDIRGPWVCIQAHWFADKQAPGRRAFAFVTGLILRRQDEDRVIAALQAHEPGRAWLPEPPKDYYTFAGAIPWSDMFAAVEYAENRGEEYERPIRGVQGDSLVVQVLAHEFSWESYHSKLNQVRTAYVPSRRLSSFAKLRARPQSFSQVDSMGNVATMTLGGPRGLGGAALYVRADVLHKYASGRRFVLHLWGERQLSHNWGRSPKWLDRVREANLDSWRAIFRTSGPTFRLAKVAETRKSGQLRRTGASDSSGTPRSRGSRRRAKPVRSSVRRPHRR